MKKKFQKRTLLIAALTMSTIALGNFAKADLPYLITNETELHTFLEQTGEATGKPVGNIQNGFSVSENIGNVTSSSALTLYGGGYIIDGQSTTSGFTVGNDKSLSIDNLTMQNFKNTSETEALGGAIYNHGTMNISNSTFTENYAESTGTNQRAYGGAVLNYISGSSGSPTISAIDANFTKNYVKIAAATTYPMQNYVAGGGAVAQFVAPNSDKTLTSTIGTITGTYEANYAQAAGDYGDAYGGAILNYAKDYNTGSNATATITNITADFTGNSAIAEEHVAAGGAVANVREGGYGVSGTAKIENITGTFDGNFAKATGSSGYAYGGAIYNAYGTVTISDSTFKNNYAETTNIANADGGAIYNTGTSLKPAVLNLTGTNIFENNYVTDGTQKIYSDIYNSDTLNISGNISMTGGITGFGTTNIASGTVVKLGHDATLSQYTLNIDNATIDLQNGTIDTLAMRHPNKDSVVTFKLDYDGTKSLAQSGGGNIDYVKFEGNTSGISNVNVKVSAINVIADGETSNSAKWFDGGTGVTISTPQTIKAATQNYIYTFTKNSNGKSFNIEAKDIGNLTLGEIVHESDYSFITSYSLSDNYNFKEDEYLGDLAGADREFTIFGNGYTIDAAPSNMDITAIKVSEGQTFNLDNVTMKGFKTNHSSHGGVINNKGTIDSLTADFTNNKASNHLYNTSFIVSGGVIYNSADADKTAKIKNITGTFTTNCADAFAEEDGENAPYNPTTAQGGAITNNATSTSSTAEIDDINADFTSNYTKATITNEGGSPISAISQGGAIYNYQKTDATALIKNITGTFSGNYANATATAKVDDATATAQGGAIYNEGATINSITGGFTGNYVIAATTSGGGYATSEEAQGGAIYNGTGATINSITADFTGNYVMATATSDSGTTATAQGGAIYNGTGATIKDMNGTFEGNYTKTMVNSDPSSGFPQGGAIFNIGTIGDTTDQTKGGIGTSDKYAVFKYNGIEFVPVPGSDEVTPELRTKKGGAITNIGTINNVYADFTQNAVTEEGGAIWNASGAKIKAITGVFNGNIADGNGGAIYNNGGTIGYDTDKGGIGTSDKYAVFSGNGVNPENTVRTKNGGAIYNTGTITNIYADFEGNSAKDYGGAISNIGTATIGNITGTFSNNYVSGNMAQGGAIYNFAASKTTSKITEIDADFTGNKTTTQGGAISNRANSTEAKSIISKITGEFKENTAASGGAISNFASSGNAIAEIELIDEAIFKDNYVTSYGGAIYNHQSNGTTATITLKDVIFENNYVTDGTQKTYNDIHNPTGTINITGNVSMTGGITNHGVETPAGTTNITSTGTLTLLHAIDEQGTVKDLATLNQSKVNINNGTLSIQNGVGGDELTISNLGVETGKTANFKIDLDPANGKVDRFLISNDGTGNGSIALTDIKMFSDIPVEYEGDNLYINWAVKNNNYVPVSNWTDTTGTIYSATKDYFYTFAKSNTAGEVVVDLSGPEKGKKTISKFDLPKVVQAGSYAGENHPEYEKIWNYTVTADSPELTEDIGILNGTDRNLTITGGDGAQQTLNGNNFGGITVKSDKTLSVENLVMQNFKKTDNVGAVIYNEGGFISSIKNVTFKDNLVTQTGTDAKLINGGAIANMETMGNISGSFNNNSVEGAWTGGGAIWNMNEITGTISSNFTGNNAKSTGTKSHQTYGTPEAYGGAIANVVMSSIDSITGNFSQNYAKATKNALGGAIYNKSYIISPEMIMVAKINNIGTSTNKVQFSNNYAESTSDGYAQGGAIWNAGTITNMNATFTGNYAKSVSDNAYGGAILNDGLIYSINADFIENSTSNNYALAEGGAIFNSSNINNITGTFNKNSAKSTSSDAYGGAIYNTGNINNITGTFTNNSATGSYGAGGAIYNTGKIDNITGTFTNNSATGPIDGAHGGAIYNTGSIAIANALFTGNTATTSGGAIFNSINTDIVISNSTFSGNTANGKPNDIMNAGSLTFKGTNSLDGGITDAKSVNASYENRGTTYIGDGIAPTTVTLGNNATLQQKEVVLNHNATLALGSRAAAGFLTNVDTFTVNGCALSLQNGTIDDLGFNNLVLNDDLTMMVDADLYNLTMDQISANTYSGSGNILVSNIKLLSDSPLTSIGMTFVLNEDGLREKVKYTGEQGISYSPKYKYNVAYDSKTGMFNFTRSGGNDLNPALYASSVALQGMYLTQINTYEQAFANMDQLMLMSRAERTAWKMANKYAAENTNNGVISYDPNQSISGKGVWFRPFASFENVPLNNGPKVDNFSYGGLVGGDSDLIELKHGWDMVWGAYAGYNGSHQKYDGISMYQNGGTLGLNATWYKGNFFTGLTGNIGASGVEASTTFGRDNFVMLATGIASKSGYNWELFNSKFIIQPSFLMSYSFINAFNYTSASGVSMHHDPLNAIQLVPGLKFIGNLPKGWQPYIGVSMIWNLLDKTKVTADDIGLSEMSVDPFIQYGVGVQKRWGDKFTGFGQVMMRNGGRNGISLNAGFKYELGKKGLDSGKKAAVKHYTERNVSLTTK